MILYVRRNEKIGQWLKVDEVVEYAIEAVDATVEELAPWSYEVGTVRHRYGDGRHVLALKSMGAFVNYWEKMRNAKD